MLEAIAAFRRLPVDPSLVVWESFAGNGMLCNPEALYRTVRADRRFAHLQHVWVLDDPPGTRRSWPSSPGTAGPGW